MDITKEAATHLHMGYYSYPDSMGEELTLSQRPTSSIGYFESGEAALIAPCQHVHVRQGNATFIPQGESYILRYLTKDIRYVVAHFNFPNNTGCLAQKCIPMQTFAGSEEIHTLLRDMLRDCNTPGCALAVMARFYTLCDLVLPQLRWEPAPKCDPRIALAMEILERDCREKLPMEWLAARCSVSSSHFHALFKKETGMTPVEYRNRAVIRFACQLLLDEPSMSVEEIACACGFETSSHFRRIFREFTGVSPREYRQKELI